MKNKLALLTILFAETVLAHPGHGREGFFHSHEEWLVCLGLFVLALVVVSRK